MDVNFRRLGFTFLIDRMTEVIAPDIYFERELTVLNAVLNTNNVLPLTHQHSRQTMTHFCEMLLFCSLIRNDRKHRQHGLKTE